MPVPDLETWRQRWAGSDQERLGVRPLSISERGAIIAVELPYGDERDDDPLFTTAALTYVADIAALSSVLAHLGEDERPNGTASLHLNYITPPSSSVEIEAHVSAQNELEAIVDIVGREADGRIVLRGLVTFSVRPVVAEAAS